VKAKMINIGEKIKKFRISNNMSQYDLGNKLFVSDKTISSWETNRTLPTIDLIVKICDIFNVSLYNFIEEKNNNDFEMEIKIKTSDLENERIKNLIKKSSTY
jgi:transcriptional regulator with XRE-family HTH domain